VSLIWPLGRPWEREKKRGNNEGVGGIVWSWNFWKIGKLKKLGLWRKERIKEKEKGKRKRNCERRYFLGIKK